MREDTARRVKELAHTKGLTVDELISELMNPSGKEGWSTCHICGAKVKSRNLHEHITKVHPKLEPIDQSKVCEKRQLRYKSAFVFGFRVFISNKYNDFINFLLRIRFINDKWVNRKNVTSAYI